MADLPAPAKHARPASVAQHPNQTVVSNSSANAVAEKVSPQKAAKDAIFSLIQKSPSTTKPKMQLKGAENWFSM